MKPQKTPTLLLTFWHQGFFSQERTSPDVMARLSSLGSNPTSSALNNALSRASFLSRRGKTGKYRWIQKHSPSGAAPSVDVLPDTLIKALGPDFKQELADLRHNYGVSGNCTAFLLRKILEKLLFLAFAKNGKETLLEKEGSLVGLKAMLALSTTTKVAGKPFLMKKTADAIEGIKFLGDTAAHNPMASVAMKTIEPVMPFIITAYSELASKL
ncbi:MAG: hypothetical protein MUO23_08630 [Anaerolineales bacterium]|nr:hypothetical protein [Anaerolineales bacterium]